MPRVERAVGALFRDVVALGGTLSGEHGIGVLKARLSAARAVERADRNCNATSSVVFDPEHLLNPGKIFAGDGRPLGAAVAIDAALAHT